MRYAGNFHPEWGYLAPAPSFLRTLRIVIVAVAVGATASAAVVFALIERPAADTSVAARTMAVPLAAAPVTMAAPAPMNTQASANAPTAHNEVQPAKPLAAGGQVAAPAISESGSLSTAQTPTGMAALAETQVAVPATTDAAPGQLHEQNAPAADAAPPQKKVTKKHRSTPRYASRGEQPTDGGRGPLLLHGLFNSAPGNEYSANDPYRGFSRDSRWGAHDW
jgi:hypothetical protein